MNNKHSNIKAFTLIELSIVMVIIGLIISGVLLGQDLIHGAQIRATIAQLDKYSIAVQDFRLKFQALPGDYSSAQSYIAPPASGVAIINGNGDSLICNSSTTTITVPSGTANVMTTTSEYQGFWEMLSAINAIEGLFLGTQNAIAIGGNIPATKISNAAGIFVYANTDNTNYYHVGVATNASGFAISQPTFNPLDALSIDTKMDDGVPNVGRVQARAAGSAVAFETTSGTTYTTGAACVNDGASNACICGTTTLSYNGGGTPNSVVCALRVQM